MSVPETPRVFPRRLPETTRKQRRARALRIASVTTKHFGPIAYRRARKHELPPNFWVRPLRLTFEELGTTFLKYGQLIGSAPGVFGDDVADEFRSCLDTGPAVPFDQVKNVIEDELGMPLADAFAMFDPDPIGSASIAVVHRATTHDGHDVAVKVLRPGIEQRVAVDLDLLHPLLEVVARQTGDQLVGSLLQLFDGFRLQLGEELDLRNEARAMTHYRELLDLVDLPLVTVPEVRRVAVGLAGADDGVPRRRADRRPRRDRGTRHRSSSDRGASRPRVPADRDSMGQLSRRRTRRQPVAATRWTRRCDRLGHRRPTRP